METAKTGERNDIAKELSESERLERAVKYWESRLEGEEKISIPQNLQCEFSIVVPVYNERIDRIRRQIDSIGAQTLHPVAYEVIYVVNNGDTDESEESQKVFRQNQEVIDFLRSLGDPNIFVVDKSSSGHEIPECNVGKARNRGVAEASLRFYQNGKNGIIIQTDADTYFEDAEYLKKVQDVTRQFSDVIGIAGGLIYEFNPDTDDEEEVKILEKKVKNLILLRKWSIFNRFLRNGQDYSPVQNTVFSGANMISRSYETAVVGGLIDAGKGEDPQFSLDLSKYAEHNHARVIGMKNELKVVTAIRESDRTEASFGRYFDEIDPEKSLEVKDPDAPELEDFRSQFYDILNNNPEGIASLVSFENGELIISSEAVDEAMIYIKEHGFRRDDPFYLNWSRRYFGADNFVDYIYFKKYPKLVLDDDLIRKFSALVIEKDGGLEVVEKVNKIVSEIRVAKI